MRSPKPHWGGDRRGHTAHGVPSSLRGAATYLPQGVDIDLPPLPALAEVHGGSHQQNVGDAVAVDIEGVDLATVVGANLEETEEGMRVMLLACRGTATLPSGDRRDISSFVPATATQFRAVGAVIARESPTARWMGTI